MLSAVSAHARRLAVVLEVLALLALVSGFFPIALSSPIWWLRLGDSLVNLAPVLLLAVILLRFASFTLNPDADEDRLTLTRQTVQLASRWGLVFALLVPLQLISFGWLWFDSADKLSAQLNQATTELSGLRNRVNAAGSEAELQRLQASTIPGLLPPPGAGLHRPAKSPAHGSPGFKPLPAQGQPQPPAHLHRGEFHPRNLAGLAGSHHRFGLSAYHPTSFSIAAHFGGLSEPYGLPSPAEAPEAPLCTPSYNQRTLPQAVVELLGPADVKDVIPRRMVATIGRHHARPR